MEDKETNTQRCWALYLDCTGERSCSGSRFEISHVVDDVNAKSAEGKLLNFRIVFKKTSVCNEMKGFHVTASKGWTCFCLILIEGQLSPCRHMNGGCGDLCLLTPYGRVNCTCRGERVLLDDNRCVCKSRKASALIRITLLTFTSSV